MTTYNTGNPLGSVDVKDLYDNAENLDDAVNSLEPTWVDRFGRTRSTMQGVITDAVTASELAANDGASKIGYLPAGAGAVPTDVQSKLRERISLEDYQDASTNPAGLNNAITVALARGDDVIYVADQYSVNGTLVTEKTTQVALVGGGSIAGPYRKRVVPSRRSAFSPVNTINPEVHLQKLTATDSPVVVIMGDSISSEGPNVYAQTQNMWSLIKEKLKRDNPQKNFTFHNRAIGGQNWLNANTKPTAFPFWYTNTANDWLTYIEALQPDTVFLAFGMNDSNGFNAGAVPAVVNKIKAWAKVPDIVFVTNPVPAQATVFPDGTGFGFRGQTFQEGRDYAAGYVRTYAAHNKYGVIDVNRTMVAMRDSYDVTAGFMRQVESVTASHYVAPEAAFDFAFGGVADGSTWPEGKVLAVKCGLQVNDFLFVVKTGGNFVFNGFAAGVSTYASVSTGVAIPSGQFNLEVSIIGGVARLMVDTSGTTWGSKRVIAEFPVVRHGGIFLPGISWQGESAGPFVTIEYISGYKDPKYKQVVTDEDVWGPSDISPSTKPEYGGNGINHYSTKGLELVVRPTVEACDFACPAYTAGIHAGGRWIKYADGTAIFSKKVTWTGNISAANGNIFLEGGGVADTDFPAIFMSDGASGFVFQTSFHVMSDGANFVWVISGGGSRVNNAIRYRLASSLARTGITVDIHITMTGRWK